MNNYLYTLKHKKVLRRLLLPALLLPMLAQTAMAQEVKAESTATEAPVKKWGKPVRNTFESIWLIDAQTVEVPVKGTFEMDFRHRFGLVNNGYKDFYGFCK